MSDYVDLWEIERPQINLVFHFSGNVLGFALFIFSQNLQDTAYRSEGLARKKKLCEKLWKMKIKKRMKRIRKKGPGAGQKMEKKVKKSEKWEKKLYIFWLINWLNKWNNWKLW